MELSDLTIFSAVVEAGGVSRAASLLNRVPSNITSRIQKLESELGKDLFIREKNRLRISPAGESLLLYAKQILQLADEAIEYLDESQPKGKLKLGSMEALAASRLSIILTNYHRLYPEVELEVKTNPTGILIDQVLEGDVDLALVADPPDDHRLASTPIFNETLVLVSDKSYDDIRHPSDLGDKPTLLGFSARCAYRNRLASWISEGDTVAKVVEINSYHALLNCVTAGMGVGLIPQILLEYYPFKDGLNSHQLPTHLQQSTTHMIWRKDSIKPSLIAFSELLIQASNLDTK